MNHLTVTALHKMGASRIILARELSMDEIKRIKDSIPDDVELEAFVHGAMCMAYSGRCLLSSFLTGRQANRGECTQPCRWEYSLVEKQRPGEYMPIMEDEHGTYILNSRDLCMIEHLAELNKTGVDSIKIEGRMKTSYYTAVVTNAYRRALNLLKQGREDVYKRQALAIHTPMGVIVHTGDFKVDFTPVDGDPIDLAKFAELGSKGVLLLMADSTNVEREGFTMSERSVGRALERFFDESEDRRIIVATFASNIHRIQQIVDLAAARGRKVCFLGRSMENVASIAMDIGEMTVPDGMLVEPERLEKVPYEEMVRCV